MTGPFGEVIGDLVGNVAGFVSRAQAEGYSARAALAVFRSAGGAIRDSRWYNAWGEVGGSKVGQVETGAYPLASVPDAGLLSRWEAGKPGQFATQVRVLVRAQGSDEWQIRNFTHVTNGPHAGQEAIDAAVDTYSVNEQEYEEEVGGGFVSGFYQMTGPAQ